MTRGMASGNNGGCLNVKKNVLHMERNKAELLSWLTRCAEGQKGRSGSRWTESKKGLKERDTSGGEEKNNRWGNGLAIPASFLQVPTCKKFKL